MMKCRVYTTSRDIGVTRCVKREEKDVSSEREITRYCMRMAKKYGKGGAVVEVEVVDEQGKVVADHIM